MHLGYVKLHRQLCENEIWLDKPFSRGQAWVDLIILANHSDGFIRVRGNRIDIKRGQVGWSQQRLAERWGWSRRKVSNYLRELEEKEQQIAQQKNNKSTVITLINYEKYQCKSTAESTADDTAEAPQKHTNKNDKNDKNKKGGVADAKPQPCPEGDWRRYLSYSRTYLERHQELWGKLVKISDSRIKNGAIALDNLIRVQGFPKATVHETIEWARVHDFWGLQLRSLGSLTKKSKNGETKFSNILAARAKEINDAR